LNKGDFEMNIDKIFKNNEEWILKQLELDENYFENLSKGQAPEFLYIVPERKPGISD